MQINELILEDFITLDQVLPLCDDNQYVPVYDSLLRIAERLVVEPSNDSLIGLAHMAYGWMRRSLNFRLQYIGKANFFINAEAGSIETCFFTAMKNMINNSIIGSSKVLHFAYPHLYPIWDSKVCGVIYGLDQRCDHGFCNNIDRYQRYVAKLRELSVQSEAMEVLKKNMIEKGYCTEEVSNLRVLESILFYRGRALGI